MCLKSVESKHEGYRYLLDSSDFYCCLAPQTKINKIVYLDDETEKRINLQFLNEPYCISHDNDYYYDDNEIYVTNKCGDLDSVDLNDKDMIVNSICSGCNMETIIILKKHILYDF